MAQADRYLGRAAEAAVELASVSTIRGKSAIPLVTEKRRTDSLFMTCFQLSTIPGPIQLNEIKVSHIFLDIGHTQKPFASRNHVPA